MVSYSQSDMKMPVRPAPAPPSNTNKTNQKSVPFMWNDRDFAQNSSNISRSSSVYGFSQPSNVKKKPPPRPPPPKFTQNLKNYNKQGINRPSDLLSGLVFRQKNSQQFQRPATAIPTVKNNSGKEVATSVLIELDSPSGSPTLTSRSSDGVSVNSFSSDGSSSNNGHSFFGGNSSQNESGFEDDFDLFNGRANISSCQNTDLRNINSVSDPFLSPQTNISQKTLPKSSGNSTFFDLKFEYYSENNKSTTGTSSSFSSNLPTIIRPKPPRPPTFNKLREVSGAVKTNVAPISSCRINRDKYPFEVDNSRLENEKESDNLDWSPPMPSVPPPPLPLEAFLEVDTDVPPDIPPRPVKLQPVDLKKPYGIALYDYPATHPDDLALQINDTVFLIREINADWLFGKVGDCEGMFPANFIDIKVPLPVERKNSVPVVTALYPFDAETMEDLSLPVGACISVLSRVNNDWLYGEYGGRRGQFPASFVDYVPESLPHHKL